MWGLIPTGRRKVWVLLVMLLASLAALQGGPSPISPREAVRPVQVILRGRVAGTPERLVFRLPDIPLTVEPGLRDVLQPDGSFLLRLSLEGVRVPDQASLEVRTAGRSVTRRTRLEGDPRQGTFEEVP
ncbi:MAG: hypothetical protein AB1758_05285 [Candidatus Eremiobacterota bacterium]